MQKPYIVLEDKVILYVRISPNANSCKVCGFYVAPKDELFVKIAVNSVPEKGKANAELISFLAKRLKLAKSTFEILSGKLDRYKKIAIEDVSERLIEQLDSLVMEK